MTNYTLDGGPTPVHIQQSGYTGVWSLQNAGNAPVYVDNNPSVTSATGYVVLPGVALPLAAGYDIWAIAAPGQPTSIQTIDGVSGSLASVVDISGPVTIGGNVNATITNATVPISGAVTIAS